MILDLLVDHTFAPLLICLYSMIFLLPVPSIACNLENQILQCGFSAGYAIAYVLQSVIGYGLSCFV
jgi:hypothetical protein